MSDHITNSIKDLLYKLTEEFPPGERQKHSITINSEKGILEVNIWINNGLINQTIYVDDEDFNKENLFEEIRDLIKETTLP